MAAVGDSAPADFDTVAKGVLASAEFADCDAAHALEQRYAASAAMIAVSANARPAPEAPPAREADPGFHVEAEDYDALMALFAAPPAVQMSAIMGEDHPWDMLDDNLVERMVLSHLSRAEIQAWTDVARKDVLQSGVFGNMWQDASSALRDALGDEIARARVEAVLQELEEDAPACDG